MAYYVYVYLDPRKKYPQPFYIGKGSGNRYKSHLNETSENTINKQKFYKIQSIRKEGKKPIIKIIRKNLSEIEAYDLESKLINFYGRKGYDQFGVLTNICLDARPPNHGNATFVERFGISRAKKIIDKRSAHPKSNFKPFKGKTWEEIYGDDGATQRRKAAKERGKKMKGLSYEERFGEEKAKTIKHQISTTNKEKGISPPRNTEKHAKFIQSITNKSYEERFGIERAVEIKKKQSNKAKGRNLGKSHQDRYGTEKAKEVRDRMSKHFKGKTWEEIYGKEKANEMRIARRKKAEERRAVK